MEIKVSQAAEFIGGKIFGDPDVVFTGLADIKNAAPTDLTFIYNPAYQKYLETTKASSIIVNPSIKKTRTDLTYIEVEDSAKGFYKILIKYFNPTITLNGIDESAFIHPTANIGQNTSIGKNVVIEENCIIGNNTTIFHNTVILRDCKIGNSVLIYPNVTIRENSEIGDNVIIHSGTVIGADGFGYSPDKNGVYTKIPQIGKVIIENDVELGANVTIDKAALGATIIQSGTKIDNLVQVGHNVEIGKHTAISAQSGISGSTIVGNHVVMGGQVGLADHLEIADGVLLGAQSGVGKSIKKPGKYFGSPALDLSTTLRLMTHYKYLPEYADKISRLEKKLKSLEEKLAKLDEDN
ncbi:MAG: UDP-3-O-(3-hydroxymyristoyl)glucosamine N-acyltransferase [Melioribacteraceae bacterium]|nr:UDP-3-O-(3-hydroxymyristoyl)glucosamine N-acyltransferase [Melioribacteraceae bacterium]